MQFQGSYDELKKGPKFMYEKVRFLQIITWDITDLAGSKEMYGDRRLSTNDPYPSLTFGDISLIAVTVLM